MDDSDRLSSMLTALEEQLGRQRFEVWCGTQTDFAFSGGVLHITCASTTEIEWFRRRLHAEVHQACETAWGGRPSIVYGVRQADDASGRDPTRPANLPIATAGADGARPGEAAPAVPPRRRERNAHRWTLETFVVGSANRLAVRSIESAVEQPGRFSPLLVFGSTGVGKSHLLQAAATESRRSPGRPAVLHLTAEQFTAQFLAALPERALPSFRQKCRHVDVLLIDDVQFLIGKKATLEELLYTIDAVHQRGGQVLLTADRPPNEFPVSAAPLTAKLAGGLAMPMDAPDYSMRHSIVAEIARRTRVSLEPGVAELIAQQIIGSARLIAGAINRLVATSMALGRPIDLEMAGPVLAEFARQNTPQVRLADVQRAVCDVFGVEPASLKSKKKTRAVVEPRMIAMWLARRYTRSALSEIGDYFGRRSHSTVLAAQKKCDRLVSQKAMLTVGDAPCSIDDAIRRVEAALRTA